MDRDAYLQHQDALQMLLSVLSGLDLPAFLAEWRANEEHVASQLDQLPRGTKAGADTYNIGQAVLVRYVEGTS